MTLATEPVRPTDREAEEARGIEARLQRFGRARLISEDGERVELPDPLFRVLKKTAHLLAQGHAVAIVPYHRLLTTQQAAELLNVSRPYLIGLLEAGQIHYQKVGTHRRIRFDELMKYRERRDAERRHLLAKATRLGQKLGMYRR